MLHGVLNMPPELWRDDEPDKMQRYDRYMQASRKIEDQENQIDKLNKVVSELHKKTRKNPEMWDTDGICFLIDEALAELKRLKL